MCTLSYYVLRFCFLVLGRVLCHVEQYGTVVRYGSCAVPARGRFFFFSPSKVNSSFIIVAIEATRSFILTILTAEGSSYWGQILLCLFFSPPFLLYPKTKQKTEGQKTIARSFCLAVFFCTYPHKYFSFIIFFFTK